ncbi:hypothetical protein [Micromonospora coerulea]|uniref:hypothetical protein n=1 Tax=Micromonospora coerulea TaxID=47856 RepID=UPI0031F84584
MRLMGFGYEEDPLIDGGSLLGDRLFWPTYLLSTMLLPDDSLVREAFVVGAKECDEYFLARLDDSEAWPAFRLGLRDGHEIWVVLCNDPDDSFTDFLMCRAGGERPLRLAVAGGNEFLPGLSWTELLHAVSFTGAPYGVTDQDARLLLLLPALGDPDLPAEAATRVAQALAACGANDRARDLAAYLLERRAWSRWRSVDGVMLNDGRHSLRNPHGPVNALADADLREVSSTLALGDL